MLNESHLAQFSCTEQWYRHPLCRRLIYTDGVKYVAENGGGQGAYWLIDAIASYQGSKELKGEEFQIWELTVDLEKKTCVLTCRADTGLPALVTQEIEYTDFDLPYIKFYCEGTEEQMTLCLPAER